MEITSYTNQDQEQVTGFFRTIYKEMGWQEEKADHLDDPKIAFHLPNGIFLLIKEDDRIIGTGGIIKLAHNSGLMKKFYIDQNYRGKGVAQLLLQKLLEEAKEMKLTQIVLDASNSNTRAIRFYEKNSFSRFTPQPINTWKESQSPAKFQYFYIKLE